MVESWVFTDSAVPASAATALDVLQERIAAGRLETWLTSSRGRSLAISSNTDRAMVMLLDDEADPGEHALSPGANGSSSGFVLANGQHDEYPDEDTVPLTEAMRIVRHILTTGVPPTDAAWAIDR
ncbi:Imm1 family immunity protein [Streptomyces sp. CLCI03]